MSQSRRGPLRHSGRTTERTANNRSHAKTVQAEVRSRIAKLLKRPEFSDWEAALKKAVGETVSSHTYKTLLQRYAAALETCGLRASTLKDRKQRAERLQNATWAALPIGGFGVREVAEWASERRQSVSGQTLLHELTAASAAYKWAESEGLLPEEWPNPFLAYRQRRMKRIERKRRVALTEKELRLLSRVVIKTEPDFWPLFLAAVSTGWRLSELAGLQWRDVEQRNGALLLKTRPETEKNGYRKVAHATPQLAALLAKAGTPLSLVFARNGKSWNRHKVRGPMKRVIKRCTAIPDWKRFGDGESVKALDFHSLRHTVRSILAERKHDPFTVGQTLGQADPQTAMRYTHASDSGKAAIAADISAVLGGGAGIRSRGSSTPAREGVQMGG